MNANLTVNYKGTSESTNRTKTISVDVTSIYNAGKAAEHTVNTYPVTFAVTFSDNANYSEIKNVEVECKDIFNLGVPNYRWIYAQGNDGNVAVRTTASANGTVLGRLYSNTRVIFLSTSGNFTKISYGGYTGYVNSNYVFTTAKENRPVVYSGWYVAPGGGEESNDRYIYDSNSINPIVARLLPNSSGQVVGYLNENTIVTYYTVQGDYTQVIYDNFFVFIDNNYVHKTPKSGASIETIGWAVEPSNTVTGWMDASFIVGTQAYNGVTGLANDPGSAPSLYPFDGTVKIKSGSTVNIRINPGTEHNIIYRMPVDPTNGSAIKCGRSPIFGNGYEYKWMPVRYTRS